MIKTKYWRLLNIIRDIKLVRHGFQQQDAKGQTPVEAYHAMRRLFVQTNGRSNDFISSRIARKRKLVHRHTSGAGLFSDTQVDEAVKNLRNQGYYIFPNKLPEPHLKSLIHFGKTQPCRALQNRANDKQHFQYAEEKVPYTPNTASPKFNFDACDIVGNPVVQTLMMDSSLYSIGEKFLSAQPILDLVAMWWSQPCEAKAHSSAAQLFHFDLDRIKFLKFFFYLTDVTPETGPHCYVAGSSKRKPKQVRRDGRITDSEIHAAFPKDDILELCGKAGTIMVVDTRGFHKGKALTEANRLLLQIEMCNSMFGQTYPPIPFEDSWDDAFKTFERENSEFLSLISAENHMSD